MPFSVTDEYLLARSALPAVHVKPRDSALLVVDMQCFNAHPSGRFITNITKQGFGDYYRDRLTLAVGNLKCLLSAWRVRRMLVAFSVIEAATPDGRDRSLFHKRVGMLIRPGTDEANVIPELQRRPEELLIRKTTSSALIGTNLNFALRNAGISTLVLGGAFTNGCVESTARDAADLSYNVIIVEDACAAVTESLHTHSLEGIFNVYARVTTAARLVQDLSHAESKTEA